MEQICSVERSWQACSRKSSDRSPSCVCFLYLSTCLPGSNPSLVCFVSLSTGLPRSNPCHVCFSQCVNIFARIQASVMSCLSLSTGLPKSRPLSCLLSLSTSLPRSAPLLFVFCPCQQVCQCVSIFAKIQAPVMSVFFFLSTGLLRSRPLSCSVGQRWTRWSVSTSSCAMLRMRNCGYRRWCPVPQQPTMATVSSVCSSSSRRTMWVLGVCGQFSWGIHCWC